MTTRLPELMDRLPKLMDRSPNRNTRATDAPPPGDSPVPETDDIPLDVVDATAYPPHVISRLHLVAAGLRERSEGIATVG